MPAARISWALFGLLAIATFSEAQEPSPRRFVLSDSAIAVYVRPPLLPTDELRDASWKKFNTIFASATGVPLTNVNAILALAAPPGTDGIPRGCVVVQLRQQVPVEQLFPQLQSMGALSLSEDRKTLVGKLIGERTWEVRPISATTLLIGESEMVREMLVRERLLLESDLTRLLEGQRDSALQICLVTKPLQRIAASVLSDPRLLKEAPGIDQLASQLRSASFRADLRAPQPTLELILQTESDEAAQRLLAFVAANWRPRLESFKADPASVWGEFASALAEVEPKLAGDQVILSTQESPKLTSSLLNQTVGSLLLLGGSEGEFQTRKTATLDNLKKLAYAVHAYADKAGKHFPPQTSRDPDGRPLLSWRVHLLPFVDQQALYDQFHLDEPWNSPHNMKLVAQMPAIYTIPGDEALAAAGKTRFQLPLGTGMPGEKLGEIWFRDITDGTSNTILFVEAPPEQAIVWTEPSDLPVDLEKPKAAILPDGSPGFAAVFYDGSPHFFEPKISVEKMKALLTHQGGEVVPD